MSLPYTLLRHSTKWFFLCIVLLTTLLGGSVCRAALREDTLHITTNIDELLLTPASYSVLEDPTGRLTIQDVHRPEWLRRFTVASQAFTSIQHPSATYWLRLTLHDAEQAERHWYLELLDSHINSISLYQDENNAPIVHTGADLPFNSRPYFYKNFLFRLPLTPDQTHTYYIRLQSSSKTSFLARIRTETILASHFQREYGLLGGFYGVLLIMVIYNLCIYLFIREQMYLRYVAYVLSCSLVFLSEDGLGFQYLWPTLPWLNQLVNAVAPVLLLLTFSYYARQFMDSSERLPQYDAWVRRVVLGSAVLLLLDALVLRSGLGFWLYPLPYTMVCYLAVRVYQRGFRPAIFFLAAHSFVAISVLFLVLRKLGIHTLTNTFTVYSMNVAFVLEIAVLSYALGDKIKAIKDATIRAQERLVKQLRKRQHAQSQLLEQLQQNQQLKDQLNSELEAQVASRTEELRHQSETIAGQNRELMQANRLLALQSAAIEKLNAELQHDLQQAQEARVLSREVDFGEFSQIYPDKEACLTYLAELKWSNGYQCRRCGHEKYCDGREAHSRRCTRCRYVESATAYTLFQKCKFSIVKAFYAVFLLHTHHGNYSSQELSRVLDLRQGTCWSFSQKVAEAMRRREQAPEYDDQESWTKLLLDTHEAGVDDPLVEQNSVRQ
ncbi:7TM diverse intracellular signaling domain-containing protein [Hymenobacter profundi]|uniref:Chromosome partitioning protein ParA n=1 Tax=Hymenobacter profundi TaxID=1982110 RepID=A0ABS6X507_9BACT|nr:7TM diverse intracellular signaling domain-containing protein [Hymenobacter profundi]MBW3130019.1 hypothetical protein [Hymenobacter profundi]